MADRVYVVCQAEFGPQEPTVPWSCWACGEQMRVVPDLLKQEPEVTLVCEQCVVPLLAQRRAQHRTKWWRRTMTSPTSS